MSRTLSVARWWVQCWWRAYAFRRAAKRHRRIARDGGPRAPLPCLVLEPHPVTGVAGMMEIASRLMSA